MGAAAAVAMGLGIQACGSSQNSATKSHVGVPGAIGSRHGGDTANPSSTTSPNADTAPTTSVPAPSGSPCATSNLGVTLGAPGAAAGHVVVPIVFTNKGTTDCSLLGYPGVSVVDAGGTQLGAPATRSAGTSARVDLPPSGTASALLQIAHPQEYPAGSCQPVNGQGLRVYPPNQRASMVVPDQVQTCSQMSVTTLQVQPVQPGTGQH